MLLYCGICHRYYSSPKDWARHLVDKLHQVRSRHALAIGQWGITSERPNILVAYSTTSFAPPDPNVPNMKAPEKSFVTQFLNQVAWTCNLVPADFVWIPKHPKVAIVRFPSEKFANKVITAYPGKIIVGMNHVSLKKAVEFTTLEWNHLIDEGILRSLTSMMEILSLK